jgi:hypothetical protein
MIIEFLLKFFGGGVGQAIGNGVSNTVAIAALAPAAYWFVNHKEETFVTITYSDAAALGLVLFFVVKIVQYTNPQKS